MCLNSKVLVGRDVIVVYDAVLQLYGCFHRSNRKLMKPVHIRTVRLAIIKVVQVRADSN